MAASLQPATNRPGRHRSLRKFMPTKKSKEKARVLKRAKAEQGNRAAQKAGLAAMRAKLLARAQAANRGEEPKVMEQLPLLSKRKKRTLKNKLKL